MNTGLPTEVPVDEEAALDPEIRRIANEWYRKQRDAVEALHRDFAGERFDVV